MIIEIGNITYEICIILNKEQELKKRLRYLLNECDNVKSDAIMLERQIDLTFGKDFLKREEEL